jgi:hypothetical protein
MTGLLIWAASGLLALVNVLIAFIVRLHLTADDEHRQRMDKEIDSLRKRVHDLTAMVGKVDQWQRFHDEDRKHG